MFLNGRSTEKGTTHLSVRLRPATTCGSSALAHRTPRGSEGETEAMTSPRAQIGPYAINRKVGRGGMGVVLLARDCTLDRDIAIKALSQDFAGDANFDGSLDLPDVEPFIEQLLR